jgi:hypothetical protein
MSIAAMLRVCALSSVVSVFAACASPADMAKAELGSGDCADKAEDKCEDDLPNADRLGCLKRETYLCEEMEKASAP